MRFVATTLSAALLTFAGVGCDDGAPTPMDDSGPAAPEMSEPAGGTPDYNAEPLGGGNEPGSGGPGSGEPGSGEPGSGLPQSPAGGEANP